MVSVMVIYLLVAALASAIWVAWSLNNAVSDLNRQLAICEQDFARASDLVSRLDRRAFEREERIRGLIAERDSWRDEWKAGAELECHSAPSSNGLAYWSPSRAAETAEGHSAASAGRLVVGCDGDRPAGKADGGMPVLDVAGDCAAADDDVTAGATVCGGVGVPHDPGTFGLERRDIACGRSWEDYW